ncbi:MAG: L,D-transpeptidase family protein [Proteobacteria bacterium]|nr:L,D-transpeptidase family protein [Pseudomonadota bacterium]
MKLKTILLIFSSLCPPILLANTETCPLKNGINVISIKQTLNICQHGNVIKSFKVALGYNGMGKKQMGDNKTPTGLYGLAYPRKSKQYNVFIPILYPTSKQLASGYTGRDVGIHGPTQSPILFRWLNNLPSSTRGCVAVGKNNYIEYVANWVKKHPGVKVLIS